METMNEPKAVINEIKPNARDEFDAFIEPRKVALASILRDFPPSMRIAFCLDMINEME